VRYPSFKSLDWRARRTFPKMVVIILAAGFLMIAWQPVSPWLLPIAFTSYLIYGFIRPRLPRKILREIEEEEEEEDDKDDDDEPLAPLGSGR
jgi:CDP-diacylglycerol---serine O-phosphatidyltransferase